MELGLNNKHVTMKDYPSESKPIERMFTRGIASLNNNELLAILINSGTRTKQDYSLQLKYFQTEISMT